LPITSGVCWDSSSGVVVSLADLTIECGMITLAENAVYGLVQCRKRWWGLLVG